jgi:MYXO-CTERM domain-containing protein
MGLNFVKTLATASVLALATTAASAGTSDFIMVNGVDAPGIDVSLTIQASTTTGHAYDFVITNNSDTGIVTGVYLEQSWGSLLSNAGTPNGPANLNPGTLSPDIPEWASSEASHTIGQTRVRTWVSPRVGYIDRYYDALADGIQPGQSHTLAFMTDDQFTSLGDLEDAVGTFGFAVGIKVQNVVNDPYAPAWGLIDTMQRSEEINDPGTTPTGVPSPTAALAGLAMLGLAATRRRRD